MLTAIKYDKTGRARDGRGRYVSAKTERYARWAETGQIVTESIQGREVYRGPDGRIVPRVWGDAQEEKRYFIGRGKTRREVHIGGADAEQAKRPRGRAVSMDLWMQGGPRLALDLGAEREDQFLKYGGKYYRITPNRSGALSDLFRLLNDRYISMFLPFMNSPQFLTPITETSEGMIYDMDGLELMDDELSAEIWPDKDSPADEFQEFVRGTVGTFLKYHNRNEKDANKRSKGK